MPLMLEEDGDDDESIMAVVLVLTQRRGRLLLEVPMQEELTELRKAATVSRAESIQRPTSTNNRVTSRR